MAGWVWGPGKEASGFSERLAVFSFGSDVSRMGGKQICSPAWREVQEAP